MTKDLCTVETGDLEALKGVVEDIDRYMTASSLQDALAAVDTCLREIREAFDTLYTNSKPVEDNA